MKSLYALAAIVAFSAVPAFAGEGHVSTNSLAKMGLAGMKTMNDAQGMQIRGRQSPSSLALATRHDQRRRWQRWIDQRLLRRRPPQSRPVPT